MPNKRRPIYGVEKRASTLFNKGGKDVALTKEQKKEFENLAWPLIKFINDNFNPHTSIIIDNTSAEIMEGVASYRTEEFWKD
jgi:hypothetical protein